MIYTQKIQVIYIDDWSINGFNPQKFNIDTKNGHIQKESPFPRPINLGIQPLVFRGVTQLQFGERANQRIAGSAALAGGTAKALATLTCQAFGGNQFSG